jgi:hypothetical protein
VEEEGGAVAGGYLVDLADEDGVVAGGVSGDEFAIELDESGFEERSAAVGGDEFDTEAFEFGRMLIGVSEEASPGFVILREEINAKEFLFLKEGVSFGASVDTDEDLERLKGDGGEGVGGHSMNAGSVGVRGFAHYGDDGDSGGKLSEGFTEFAGGDGHVKWE